MANDESVGNDKIYPVLVDYDFVEIIKSNPDSRYSEYLKADETSFNIRIQQRRITGTVEVWLNERVGRRIFIEDCIFDDRVSISQCDLTYISFDKVIFERGLLINGGNFNGDLNINNCYFYSTLEIYSATFKNKVIIKNSDFQKTLKIGSGEFNSSLEIFQSKFAGDLFITGGTYNDDVLLARNKILGSFIIYNGLFNKDFKINNEYTRGDFAISDGVFEGEISVGGEYQREFLIEGGKFSKKISIDSGKYNQIRVSLEDPINLKIDDRCIVLTLKFSTIIHKDSFMQVFSGLSSLIFDHTTNLGTIQFVGLKCYRLADITEWIKATKKDDNDFTYSYYVNKEWSTLNINNSDLGKVSFISCDLTGFSMRFNSSKMTDVFITGSQMPEEISSESELQKQLGYSQIKKIYETRGDKVTANVFFSKEMNAYYNTLNWCTNKAEKINLLANKFSTDHGQNWSRGFWRTFWVGCFFYIVYCLFLGIKPVVPTKSGWITMESISYFGTVMSYFVEFINPIHRADYIAEELLGKTEHVSGWARAIEGVSRIFIAYFVYQLIQAFRKHGRS